jgi:TPR repeat protein
VRVRILLAVMAVIGLVAAAATDGHAGVRRAFVVGNADYTNGLPDLENAANDAEELKKKLEQRGLDFKVTIQTNLKDKTAFLEALDEFAKEISKGDEVLFFYSGHGMGTEKGGNYFLPTSLKGEGKFFQDLSNSEKSELKDQQQRRTAYGNWVADNGVAETEIEKRLIARDPDVLIILADACRDLLPATKGAGLLSGITVPKQTAEGVFRFYSARPDQKSLESLGKQATKGERERESSRGSKSNKPKTTSVFTSALLRYIDEPGRTIGAMADEVKRAVSEQARSINHQQHPDFVDRLDGTFYFRPLEAAGAVCASADAIVYRLSQDVLRGRITRPGLLSERERMAPCGKYEELTRLLNLYDQGVGSLSGQARVDTPSLGQRADASLDPCDARAASPLDPNRPQRIQGVGIQEFAVAALANPDVRDKSRKIVQEAIDACQDARTKRQRVARFSFNLGRSYFAMATLANGDDQTTLLHQAFLNHIEAANQGYVAAYNDLGVLYESGQAVEKDNATGKLVRLPPNREKAVEFYTKGADLGHVVAQYNLGLKFKRGDIGLPQSDAKAYRLFSKAAEANYAPAMLEAGIALADERGVDRDPQRAVQLFTAVAQRGSAEAMYYLGNVHVQGRRVPQRPALNLPQNYAEAFIWYARAAELGHREAQVALARMLGEGRGVPAAQREAAGRYWRLAAQNGSEFAQRQLASLLRDGKIPFRPDLGGDELKNLYEASVARGDWNAAMDYAKLHRSGYFVGDTLVIPRDPTRAVELYDKATEISKRADRDVEDAEPYREVLPIFEIVEMHEKGETVRPDGSKAVSDERVANLKTEYGDGSRKQYFRVPVVNCPLDYYWVLLWDWTKKEPPTEAQFDWFERNAAQQFKGADCKIEKSTREEFRRQFDKSVKDKGSFPVLMAARYEELSQKSAGSKKKSR